VDEQINKLKLHLTVKITVKILSDLHIKQKKHVTRKRLIVQIPLGPSWLKTIVNS